MKDTIKIGDRVKHALHTAEHKGWVGLVVGVETYINFVGRRDVAHVRWMEPMGNVTNAPCEYPLQELVLIEEAK